MISNVNYSCEIEVWSVYMEDSGAVRVCMGIFEFSLFFKKNYMQELLIAKIMHVIFHFSMNDKLYNKFMISEGN